MKLLLKVPIINDKIKATVREGVVSAFGGRFAEVIVGGAAFNQEVEQFLHMIEFPYTVGYGMTECGPIICYEDWSRFKPGSCGKAVPRMEVKVLSSDPENIPGEIVCRDAYSGKKDIPSAQEYRDSEAVSSNVANTLYADSTKTEMSASQHFVTCQTCVITALQKQQDLP